MNKKTITQKIKDKLSDIFLALFLKVNGYTMEEYYKHWIGFTQKEYDQWLTNRR